MNRNVQRMTIMGAAAWLTATACAGGVVNSRVVSSTTEPPVPTIASTTAPPPTTATASSTLPAVPGFQRAIVPITAAELPHSWRSGCPVGPEALRRVTVSYWGFDDAVHQGDVVVHERYATAIASVFETLFAARFPIERMQLVDVYGGDDEASMRVNNTSAFNCREVAGRPGVLSQHALGAAIDINPLTNPWVRSDQIDPPEGAKYADRATRWKGGVYAGDVVVKAFASIGWGWGGDWSDSKDYQHFSATGT